MKKFVGVPKIRWLMIMAFSCIWISGLAQEKQEKEYRIGKSEVPNNVLVVLKSYLNDAKRLRFYKELDGEKSSFEVKFKKGRIFYSVEFDKNGTLEDVEFIIGKNDIPDDSFNAILKYLDLKHGKHRIKKIQQQYLNLDGNPEGLLKKAFQNLLLPQINYELVIGTKDSDGYSEYEITFNAKGEHLLTRKAINTKYDHVLFQ